MSKCSKSAKEFSAKGEKSLAEGNFSEALDNFNNCLRFASVDSDESSRAFASRAKIFYNVQLYRECSENIQLAKHDINVFNEDLRRIEEQVDLMESDNSANKWNFFKLSHDANKFIPFIVNCLEVRQDETYGRYIATTKDLSPGDILIIEEPFYKVLSPLEIHRRCAICFKQNSLNLLPCATCSTAMFCSKKCAESSIHKHECGKLEENFEKALLKRMFYQAIAICGSPSGLEKLMSQHNDFKTIMDFDLNKANENDNLKNRILATSAVVEREPWSKEAYAKYEKVTQELEAETGADKNFLRGYLEHCLKAMTVNFFHFFWTNDDGRGFAICSFASYFAHSCDPNCDKIDVENKFIFVARKPIKAGDQLSICYDRYNFLTHPLSDRQEYFDRVYTFKCSCIACTKDYKSLDKLPKDDENFKEAQVNLHSFTSAREQYLKNCEFIKDNIDRYPFYEICSLMTQNNRLLHAMGNMLPFEDNLI